MEKKKLLFVYNPRSGQEKIKMKMVGILDEFAKAGYETTVHPTQFKGDAIECIATQGMNYDLIVCSGGDGTLDEAVCGMLKLPERKPLGYIPAGSTNDFANTINVSSNMIKAANTTISGKPFNCDVGMFGDKNFIYIAAFGLLTEVSYETDQKFKNIFGHGAYLLEGVKRLGLNEFKPYDLTIVANDRIIKDRFIYGMVSNTMSIGGVKQRFINKIKLDDGMFECMFIKYPEDTIELNTTLASLIAQKPDPERMYIFQSSHIQISSEEPVAWTLDGEDGGPHKEIEITNLKQAVTIIVP